MATAGFVGMLAFELVTWSCIMKQHLYNEIPGPSKASLPQHDGYSGSLVLGACWHSSWRPVGIDRSTTLKAGRP